MMKTALETDTEKSSAAPLVVHLPDWRDGNPYQDLLGKAIGAVGWRVNFSEYPDGLLPLQRLLARNPDIQCLHLHWISPYIKHMLWSSSSLAFYAKALLLGLDVLLCRIRGRRIIWTVHNLVAHESNNVRNEKRVRSLLARIVSHLIFHSEGARDIFKNEIAWISERRSSVIPHGNYFDVYPENPDVAARISKKYGIDHTNKVVLFFGSLRKYKGVPHLISAFKRTTDPKLRLIIAGRVGDDLLRQELMDDSESDSRIILRLGFTPAEEVAPLYAVADVVAIPFERTLTSGSVVLAMSLGKAVILPAWVRHLDIIDESGALFFSDDEELSRLMAHSLKDDLAVMGRHNINAAHALAWATIGRNTAEIYSNSAASKNSRLSAPA